MISAFFSNGEFLLSVYKSTINADIFCNFISIIKYWCRSNNIDIKEKIIVVLDNASYHSWKQTVEFLQANKIKTHFLPPYSPTLAPVEILFKYLKSNIRKQSSSNFINFESSSGIQAIKQACSQISKKARHNAWREFIKEGSHSILSSLKRSLK